MIHQEQISSCKGLRVCVVGSGITGLSSAWLLHRSGAKVTLMEKDATCGGHTLTDHSSPYAIDLGFQVYNLTTYPNLVGFLECLGVDTEPSDMSFALSMDGGKLEWGSDNLDTVFAQRKNMLNLSFLAMLRDVIRFGKEAPKVLEPARHHLYRNMTLTQYLQQGRYTQGFINHYVAPMCAAVWSVPNTQVLQFPIQMLIRFWVNHHLLDIFQRPLWRVVKGRSNEYVKRVCSELPDVRTSTGVASVQRAAPGAPGPTVIVTTETGAEEGFDAVLFATHSDITLRILGQGTTQAEKEVLGAIPYSENDIYLHSDASLMPVSRKVWASWNLLGNSGPGGASAAVCVSYWANRLQHLPSDALDLFITLNPPRPPAEGTVIRRLSLAHPVFSFQSWEAQGRVAELQGQNATFFAGAWCGYGFHEDGIRAAVAATTAMGAHVPWVCRITSPKSTLMQQCFMGMFDRFAKGSFKTGYLRIILPSGYELRYGDPAYKHKVLPGEAWRGRPAPVATMRVLTFDFFRKIVLRHDTGMGEAFMDQDFTVNSLGGLLSVVVANANNTEDARGSLGMLNWLGKQLLLYSHRQRANTIEGSRKNIEEHYDAGNDMYRLFLDESMMYSSAIHLPGDDLFTAQMRKLDAIIDAASIKSSDRVLEIGCGWGAFAIRAAQRTGCHVVGLTLSKEQLGEAAARVKAAGLEDKVSFQFCDYRDFKCAAGPFDKLVSIEMIEAVGHEHLPIYFSTIGRMLKPGGTAVLQGICVPDERYEAYCGCSDFIREHVFPGGHLPSMGACLEAARGSGLSLHASRDIGVEYAVTLREWRKNWEEKKEVVLALGYSERFWLKYRFYFAYCEAGFDYRYIHNFHLTWIKDQAEGQQHSVLGGGMLGGVALSAASASAASAAVLQRELPSDPVTQALLAVYFFLVGMLVRGHHHMWILPTVSWVCAAAHAVVHQASLALTPNYGALSPERQAWWCADILHILYSGPVSVASLAYVLQHPRALLLHAQPTDDAQAAVLVASATGFFAFHLWLCVRYRLFRDTSRAIIKYTMLLLCYGSAVYKGLAVPFLAATLISEVLTVFFRLSKLQRLAGLKADSWACKACRSAELFSLVVFRALPHAVMGALVAISPPPFGSFSFYLLALLAMVCVNALNVFKLRSVLTVRDNAPSRHAHTQ